MKTLKKLPLIIFFILCAYSFTGIINAQEKKETKSLAPFVPSPIEVVDKMLELAEVKKGDVVYDIGCGDGRIVITAAEKFGARGVGIDYDPDMVSEAINNVTKKGVEKQVEIIHSDALKIDLSPATVVTMYLTTDGNEWLRPNLEKYLKPGTRVVSHDFTIKGWKPIKTETVMLEAEFVDPFYDSEIPHTLYLYIVGEHK